MSGECEAKIVRENEYLLPNQSVTTIHQTKRCAPPADFWVEITCFSLMQDHKIVVIFGCLSVGSMRTALPLGPPQNGPQIERKKAANRTAESFEIMTSKKT
jgi:hypothetical protein